MFVRITQCSSTKLQHAGSGGRSGLSKSAAGPVTDADGSSEAASRSSDAAVGCLFAAQDGCGAFVGPIER